eukprot:scaffold30738_cov105-Isochrysis_galbana.AAC.3
MGPVKQWRRGVYVQWRVHGAHEPTGGHAVGGAHNSTQWHWRAWSAHAPTSRRAGGRAWAKRCCATSEPHKRAAAGPEVAPALSDAPTSSASPTRITVRPDQQPAGAPSSSPSALTSMQKAPRTWLSSYAVLGRTSNTTGGPP